MTRQHKKWTSEEVRRALSFFFQDVPTRTIAYNMGRTVASIHALTDNYSYWLSGKCDRPLGEHMIKCYENYARLGKLELQPVPVPVTKPVTIQTQLPLPETNASEIKITLNKQQVDDIIDQVWKKITANR